MRADRAYLASLGTTGVLVASAILLLAVVSTLVAFQGWPGTEVDEGIGNLVVGGPERPVAVGPARVASEAAPAAGAVAESAAPGTAAAAAAASAVADTGAAPAPVSSAGGEIRRPNPGTGRDLREEARLQPGPDAGQGTGNLGDRTPTGGLLPETPVSAEVQRVTSGLGEATQGLTDTLGQTVGGISPPLGATLTDTGRLLADLLRALGQPRR